jgi:DNA repair protein RecO (recombination protein O)
MRRDAEDVITRGCNPKRKRFKKQNEMLYKTRGIALSFIKYKETSIIARIFTDKFGIQSYIVNSVRSKNAKTKMALFQPLTILDLVVYHNKKKEINRIGEIKCSYAFQAIPYNIKKTTIALFITELLGQTLKEEGEHDEMFDFISDSIVTLDLVEENFENFHIRFMIYLCHYLGIRPESAKMILHDTGHSKQYNREFTDQLEQLLLSNYTQPVKLKKTERNELLAILIQYYQMHFDSIRDFKSVQILKEVFS